MWVNKNVSERTAGSGKSAVCGKVTAVNSTGQQVNVSAEKQCVQLPLAAPPGVAFVPVQGSDAVVLPVGSGSLCIGCIMPQKDLQPGEIMLYSSGGATLVLKNDGTIVANNKVIA